MTAMAVEREGMEEHGKRKGDEENVSAETSAPESNPPGQEERPGFPQARADALEQLAEHYLAHGGPCGAGGGERNLLLVHITPADLREGGSAVARRLACDTGLLTALEDGRGNVLGIGRREDQRVSAETFRREIQSIAPCITADTIVPHWQGERCDYGMAVDGLLQRAGKT